MIKLLINVIFYNLFFINNIFANQVPSKNLHVKVHVPPKCIMTVHPIDFGTFLHQQIKNDDIRLHTIYYVTCTKNLHYHIEIGRKNNGNHNLINGNNKLLYNIYNDQKIKLDNINSISSVGTGEKTKLDLYEHINKNYNLIRNGIYEDNLDVHLVIDNKGLSHEHIYTIPVSITIK